MSSTKRSQRAGRHRPSRRRRRRLLLAATAMVLVAGAALGIVVFRDGEVERVCSRPDELRTRGNITLIPDAMDAFVQAEASLGHEIDVVESYRSCRQQALACVQICGSRRGCPGACCQSLPDTDPGHFSWDGCH